MNKFADQNIDVFIEPKLSDYLSQYGHVTIDYISNSVSGNYKIVVGNSPDC